MYTNVKRIYLWKQDPKLMHHIRNIRNVNRKPLPITTSVQALISGCQLALDRSDAEVPKHGVNRRVYLTTAALYVAPF